VTICRSLKCLSDISYAYIKPGKEVERRLGLHQILTKFSVLIV